MLMPFLLARWNGIVSGNVGSGYGYPLVLCARNLYEQPMYVLETYTNNILRGQPF